MNVKHFEILDEIVDFYGLKTNLFPLEIEK